MSSELLLLISLVIGIEVAMPIGTYLLFNGRYDDKTRLWLTSVCVSSVAIIFVALRPFLHTYLSHQIPWVLMIVSLLLMIEAIRRETHAPRSRFAYGGLVFLWVIYLNAIYVLDLTESLGMATYSLIMSAMCAYLWWMFHLLRKVNPSKSLLLLQIGMCMYGLPSLVRVLAYFQTGSSSVMDVYKFGLITNVLIFTFVMAVIFVSLGYWGFTLEKSELDRKHAIAGEDKATQEADRYRLLVEERDRLLVMNSRFSAVSALSSFSAMLIHDITQPLQTLQLGLHRMRLDLESDASRDLLERDISHLERTMDRTGSLVQALRTLMQSGENKVLPVSVSELLGKIDSILSSEALNNKALVLIQNHLVGHTLVLADEVMLQRIVINLVSNSLNQFREHKVVSPVVSITLSNYHQAESEGVLIRVVDNGRGFPPDLLERVGQPWSSKEPSGLGMALVLSKQLVAIWSGSLSLCNRQDGISGAVVDIWLRQASAKVM